MLMGVEAIMPTLFTVHQENGHAIINGHQYKHRFVK